MKSSTLGVAILNRTLMARPHIRDVIPSKLALSSRAEAVVFCSEFVYSVVSAKNAVEFDQLDLRPILFQILEIK